jgi:hypothetical protein
MSSNRNLSHEEKTAIANAEADRIRARHPQANFTVIVRHETDEEGKPQVLTTMLGEPGSGKDSSVL